VSALVFGGSGTVGAAVVRGLAAAEVPTTFTFHRNEERARALAAETGARAEPLDLRDPAAIQALARSTAAPLFIHCAAVSSSARLADLTLADWDDASAIHGRAPFLACQALLDTFTRAGGGDVILVGALDRAQSLPLPVHFAASQAMLPALAMSLAKELGPLGVRVNAVALGLLESGLSRDLPAKARADYASLSAFRRPGTAAEAARAIVWLALHNRYMSGKVLSVNGGI
jgi:3-oxoacyl-[acyl-carrier protein] reductase